MPICHSEWPGRVRTKVTGDGGPVDQWALKCDIVKLGRGGALDSGTIPSYEVRLNAVV